MKFTNRHADFLSVSQFAADLTDNEIAKVLDWRPHTVTYCRKYLLEHEYIRPYFLINTPRLGYDNYLLYFSLTALAKATRQKLLHSLKQSPRISWLVEIGGEYEYCASFLATTSSDMREVLHQFGAILGKTIDRYTCLLQSKLTIFSAKHIKHLKPRNKYISVPPDGTTGKNNLNLNRFDHKDIAILRVVSQTPVMSLRDIAKQVNLPFTTISDRLAKLREEKVLQSLIYLINTSSFNLQYYKILVTLRSFDAFHLKQLFLFSERHPYVTTLVECVGGWDAELGVEVPLSTTDSEVSVRSITDELRYEFGELISSISIVPLFRELKTQSFPI